jgi:Ca2+-binding RTX toxin-like protein
VLFGDSEDDDLYGGWGNDWISAGTGDDGVLGDDGRIYTSRNGLAEPLYGIAAIPEGGLNLAISTPGKMQTATINVSGKLKKTVNLTPFNVDPAGATGGIQDAHFVPTYANDIIYGGLGNDWLHGGSGDDAISGAEALAYYFNKPYNPGNVLGFNATKEEFAAYDEYNPRRKIFVNADGSFNFDSTIPFVLNFDATDGGTVIGMTTAGDDVYLEGNDRICGDLGNDWIVGGPGNDTLYGGYGSDLLNADDNHDKPTIYNDAPETHTSYEDRAYGGAGREVLIANTGGDRLIDWVGEFNSYIAPFAPFGAAAVSRTLQPQLQEFLLALSRSDGADPTRSADTGNWAIRNGEPDGELGMVQKDPDWKSRPAARERPAGRQHPRRSARRAPLGELQRRRGPGLRARLRHLDRYGSSSPGRSHRAGRRRGECLLRGFLPAQVLRGHGHHQRRQADGRRDVQCLRRLRFRARRTSSTPA